MEQESLPLKSNFGLPWQTQGGESAAQPGVYGAPGWDRRKKAKSEGLS